ncbi:MAG: ribonuclease D [Alphaproteobacteria bacterium]
MYIDTTEALQAFIKETICHAAGSYIAIDTEFVRQRTYWADLCLVQIATQSQAVLIDTHKVDVRFLEPLLTHPDIIKVIHAGRQDMEIFWKDLQLIPQPIFDTQIGAMFAGLGEGISYDNLVHKFLDVRLDKTSQYTNWAQRPLTEKQRVYALADVQYLYQVYPLLIQRLQDLGRQDWLCDEIAPLIDPQTYEVNISNVWKRIHISARGPSLAVLQDLAAWREEQCQALNYNRARLIRDDHLALIATRMPQSLEELKEVLASTKGIKGDLDALAQTLYEVVSKSLIRPADTWPQPIAHKTISVDNPHLFELIKMLQRAVAEELGIPMRLLIHKGDLEKLSRNEIQEQEIGCLSGWRYDAFGSSVRKLLSGEIGLTMGQKGIISKEFVNAT